MNRMPPGEMVARLTHPPGVNHLWRYARAGRTKVRVYKTGEARRWEAASLLSLRAAGFRRLPPGAYRLAVEAELYTIALDVDAPAKIVLDLLEVALGVSDSQVYELTLRKTRVHHRIEQHLDVRVRITPVDSHEQLALTPAADTCGSAAASLPLGERYQHTGGVLTYPCFVVRSQLVVTKGKMMQARVRIQQAAAAAGCSPSLIRRLEQQHEIPRVQRNRSGQRIYGPEDIAAIQRVLWPEETAEPAPLQLVQGDHSGA